MSHTLLKKLSLVHKPDIRIDPFPLFVKTLIGQAPHLVYGAEPYNPITHTLPLGAGFGLDAPSRSKLGNITATHYGQTWHPFFDVRVRLRDITIGELHQLLWHNANVQDPFSFKSYPNIV